MPWINTATLTGMSPKQMNADEVSWVYNGLDCCVTHEVFGKLEAQLASEPSCVRETYEFALAKQAAYLEVELRGIKVNILERDQSLKALQATLNQLDENFQFLLNEIFGHGLNWRSPTQLKTFFYGELNIKEIKKRNTNGLWMATVNEDALTQLQAHFYARPFAKYILAMRELSKKIGFLKTEIDKDGRIRTNIQVVGTDTGRLSSSASDFGTGTNLQNVDRNLRSPFIADPKQYLVECDLSQADARNVGAIIWERYLDSHGAEAAGKYLDYCESGDLHTRVTRMCWPELGWPDDEKLWKKIAKQAAAELNGEEYRQASKKLGHGTNYYGTPNNMSKQTGIAQSVITTFQSRYFMEFPLIQKWQEDTILDVRTHGELVTPFGRRRHFFGRGNDKSTWRAAIAYVPQSMTGHEMDMGVVNLWRNYTPAQLLMQVHDSILFEVPWHNHQTHIEKALEYLRFVHTLKGGRKFEVPLEAKAGWNWGGYDKTNNLLGMMEWKGEETRQPPKEVVQRISQLMR